MDWWVSPGVWIFIFVVAFLIFVGEWKKAHNIIDKLRKDFNEKLKAEKEAHFWEVDSFQKEIKNYKRRLGINE